MKELIGYGMLQNNGSTVTVKDYHKVICLLFVVLAGADQMESVVVPLFLQLFHSSCRRIKITELLRD
jgi:hypothetical protein